MEKYKISEVAKTFNITRETLIYYDTIGILKPEYISKENNYRYYSDESITKLSFILMLKDSNFSLKEIQKYLNCKDGTESVKILLKKLEKIELQIENLKNSKIRIEKEIKEIKEIGSEKKSKPFLEKQLNVKTYLLPVKEPKSEFELQLSLAQLKKYKNKNNLKITKRVTILKKDNFLNENYFDIESVGYIIDSKDQDFSELNGGTFACILHKDETKLIGESYKELLKFINEKKYSIIGNSREYFDELVVNSGKKKGRIIKICIPIFSE